MERRYPVGAELADGGASFRVWAPSHRRVEIVVDARREPIPCAAEPGGYFSALVPGLPAGSLYRYRLGGAATLPDPASRFQPDGPHGPSMLVDPRAFRWTDDGWRGVRREGQVLYEMHVGTFTREGTYAAAIHELPRLAKLGVTAVELMPVSEWAGRFGWGYDGVDPWAPTRLYGAPDDLRAFIDAAHAHGLGVLLDVVYNHFGPDGCYLAQFSPAYFTDRYENEWGDALDFDGPDSREVRAFFAANAAYWIDEFHFDGLRFDATQTIHDASPVHVLREISARARAAAPNRSVLLVAENESQDARLLRELGIDAAWNDDLHHAALAALTGKRGAYYTDYLGTPQELVSAARWGYLFQGQYYQWQHKRRGTRAFDVPAPAFVAYLENHDQVANSARGARLMDRASPGATRAMTAYLLLVPSTPLIFQGQELGVRTPFVYFADHHGELGLAVKKGRAQFLAQFPDLATDAVQARLDDPTEPSTFEACKLDASRADARVVALFEDLLALRRADPAFAQQRADRVAGAVLAPEAFALRFFAEQGDRLLVVNLGVDAELPHVAEPLLAPPRAEGWSVVWSSEDPRYGGDGVVAPESARGWTLTGRATVVLG